jgi:hypothetical protein
MKISRAWKLLGGPSLLFWATGIDAQSTTYSYQGNPYVYGATSPYTTSMSISGAITTSAPFPSNLHAEIDGSFDSANVLSSITGFAFSAG